MKNKLLMAATLAAVFLAAGGCGQKSQEQQAPDYSVINPERDFTLHDQDGKVFHLKDHRGQVAVLFFGYISCPDICPTTMAKMSRVYKLLGDKKQQVLTLFVTVDPDRDTPQKIKEYLEYFNLNAVGLTGTKQEIDAVVGAFKAMYEKVETESAMGYLFNHSDYLYMMDGQGTVRALFHTEDKPEEMAAQIKKWLK